MKNLTTISLIIFSIITTAILTAGLVFYQNNKLAVSTPALDNAGLNNFSNSSATGVNTTPSLTLNLTEISKHNKSGDCWMIINNNVYNLTSYLATMHPGGAGTIIPYCGKEATVAFDTKGGRGNAHSGYANSLLAAYLVGNLNQAVTARQTQTNTQNTNAVTPPVQNSGGGEFDD